MNLIGLEEISEYQNHYSYKLFLFDDEIRLDNIEKYVCTINVYELIVKEELKGRNLCERKGVVEIIDLNNIYKKDSLELNEAIIRFVIDETFYGEIKSDKIRII